MSGIGKNLVLIGMMGTFKSSAGLIAAERLGRLFADSDAIFEFEYSMKIADCFLNFGEDYFRKFEGKVISHLSECEGVVIATGGGVVLRQKNIDNLRQNGLIVLLTASPETILKRTEGDTSRPLLLGDKKEKLLKLIAEREPLYLAAADAVVCTDQKTPDEVADEIVKIWSESQ